MNTGSYLELYSTLIGWQLFGQLWDIITFTGVALLPLGWILVSNLMDAGKRNVGGSEALVAGRRPILIEAGLAMAILSLACVPMWPLEGSTLKYETPCAVAQTATPGATDTSWDGVFSTIDKNTTVPIWWAIVMRIGAGINHALVKQVGCVPDLTLYSIQVNRSQVDDPSTREELGRFVTDCYFEALAKYEREKPIVPNGMTLSDGDMGWAGSRLFRALPGYYDSLYPREAVPGWSLKPAARELDKLARDRATEQGLPAPPWGKPSCKEWWEDGQNGLYKRILDHSNVEPGIFTSVWNALQNAVGGGISQADLQENQVRGIIFNSHVRPALTSSLNEKEARDIGDRMTNIYHRASAMVGEIVTAIRFYPMMYVLREALPVLQALLLMFIIALLPVALVASGYSVQTLWIGTIAIFTIQTWTWLWRVVWWLEQNFGAALYPGRSFLDRLVGALDTNGFILDLGISTMYLLAPAIWSTMLVWAGLKFASSISGVFNSFTQNAAMPVAQETGAVGQAAVKTAGKAALMAA